MTELTRQGDANMPPGVLVLRRTIFDAGIKGIAESTELEAASWSVKMTYFR